MKDPIIVRILDTFKGLFTRFGVDYGVMREILLIKLMMDQRRVPTIFSQNSSSPKKEGNKFIKSLWLYALYGLVLTPCILLDIL
ncbi:hypothetical protein ACOI1C_17845 [Bacillus sp. DJP31]|uniref:hypothetical protein n=1 Tax=Bacillus sp. DJP31 TaxID=3409789 RepID=UPI003BB6CA45